VHRVGGDALGGVDGGGVAETGRGSDVVGGQSDRVVAAGVPYSQVGLADLDNGPSVAVFDPITGSEAQPPVVGSGDDHVSDTGPVSVGQCHLGGGRAVINTIRSGTAVEFGDQVPSRGDHDRVEPSRSVGNPSRERILRSSGEVADMNAAMIEVEVECFRFAFAERECGCGFGGVGEAVQLGQVEGAVSVFDVAEDAAGADRGELLIITDQSDTRTATDGELDGGVEGEGVGHAGFVDDHQGR
jgi:hypothetical protein